MTSVKEVEDEHQTARRLWHQWLLHFYISTRETGGRTNIEAEKVGVRDLVHTLALVVKNLPASVGRFNSTVSIPR